MPVENVDGDVRCVVCSELESPECMESVRGGLACVESACSVYAALDGLFGSYRRASDEQIAVVRKQIGLFDALLATEQERRAKRQRIDLVAVAKSVLGVQP